MQLQTTDAQTLQRDHLAAAYAMGSAFARTSPYIDVDDALTVALDGLATAARAYNPQRSASFWKYARLRIRWALLDFVRTHYRVSVSLEEWHEPSVWDRVELRVMARRILAKVSPEEQMLMVITEVYRRPVAEVAAACHVSSGRISQRRRAAMLRMRQIAGVNEIAIQRRSHEAPSTEDGHKQSAERSARASDSDTEVSA